MSVFLVAIGAAVGGPMRYLIDRRVQSLHSSKMPFGTLAVNMIGSLVLGLVTGAATAGHASAHVLTLLGSGFCGALTTYSAFAYETGRLAQLRENGVMAGYVALTLSGGLTLAALGVLVGGHL
jgi:fluoride exporter